MSNWPHLFWAPQSLSVCSVQGVQRPFPNLEISLDPPALSDEARASPAEAVGLRGAGASPPHCPVPLTSPLPSVSSSHLGRLPVQHVGTVTSTHAVCPVPGILS